VIVHRGNGAPELLRIMSAYDRANACLPARIVILDCCAALMTFEENCSTERPIES
jgi:hypothetical protein